MRKHKTRLALHQALIALIKEKSYGAISVQDILDRAMVGRSTFYVHFTGKDELLVSGVEDLKASLAVAQEKSGRLPQADPEDAWGFSLALFRHAQEYRSVYRPMVASAAWLIVGPLFQAMIRDLVKMGPRKGLGKGRPGFSGLPEELFTLHASTAMMAALQWWLTEKKPITAAEANRMFLKMIGLARSHATQIQP